MRGCESCGSPKCGGCNLRVTRIFIEPERAEAKAIKAGILAFLFFLVFSSICAIVRELFLNGLV